MCSSAMVDVVVERSLLPKLASRAVVDGLVGKRISHL